MPAERPGRTEQGDTLYNEHCCDMALRDFGFGGEAPPPQATGGRKPFPLLGDTAHYPRDRAFDLKHIRLEVALDFERRSIGGTSTMTLTPVNDGLSNVRLDAANMTVSAVTLSDGTPLPFGYSDNVISVELGRPHAAGEQITIVVAYAATPQRGLYFIAPDEAYPQKRLHVWSQGQDEDSKCWFPCDDATYVKTTSEVIATVPERFFALSNGRLIDTRHDEVAQVKTYHWQQNLPHAPYLMTLVAGEYVELANEWEGIPIPYYVPAGREAEGLRCFGNTPDMVRFFSEKIGVRYPWDKYAQITVGDFIFGAMENTGATTMTEYMLHDEKAARDFSADGIVAHELAHQWFGDLLTCRDWSHAWLNEGFATYFDALYTEHHLGRDEFLVQIKGNIDSYLAEDRDRYRRPIVTNVFHAPIDLFDRHLYEKGSVVLHMLRNLLGETLWWKAINHYVAKHRHQWVVTTDLQRAIEEATGRNLDWFFQQWVYQAGHPEYKAEYSWDDDAKLARIKITQGQTTDHGTPLFRMPVEVRFTTAQGDHGFAVTVEEQEQAFFFPLPSKPLAVRIDPDLKVLKTLDFSPPKELLLHQLRNAPDAMGRIEAAAALGKIGTPEAVAGLKDVLLSDGFWAVQAACARALGAVKSAGALEGLLSGAGLAHPKARRAVHTALGEFKDESASALLRQVLEQGDASYYAEASAALALGKTRHEDAFEGLQAALGKSSHNEIIRQQALEGLGELKDARGIDVALGWTQWGRHARTRERAVSALGKLGGEREDRKREVVDRLIDLLDDPWLRVKIEACTALEALKDSRAVSALLRTAERDLDGRVQRRAREAAQALRQGSSTSVEVKKLRTDLDGALDDNRKLKDRLEKLEARMDGNAGTPA